MSRLADAIAAAKNGINTIGGGKLEQPRPGYLGTIYNTVKLPDPNAGKITTTHVGTVNATVKIETPRGGETRPSTEKWPPDPEDIARQAAANIKKSSTIQWITQAQLDKTLKLAPRPSSGGPEVY